MSGEVTRTPDLVLSDTENITNAKLNRVGGGTFKVKPGSITSTELSSSISGGFGTVNLLRTNSTETFTDGDAVTCRGYYTDGAGDFGPVLYYDSSDSSTADDGLTCFVDANGARYKRSFSEPINFLWAGARATTDGDETYASTNDTAWAAVKTYLDSYPGTLIIPQVENKVFYYSTDNDSSDGCTYQLDGTLKKKANVDAVGFDILSGHDNVTLKGDGLIHGNATVSQTRAGGNGIRGTINDNLNIFGRVQVQDCEGHAVNIRQPTNGTIDGLYVRNTYGSIKAGESTSGVNMDGIHVYNPDKFVIRNCDVKSIDDAIAITMLEAYTNETSGVMVSNCIVECVKAENSAGAGDGADELVIAGGFRITQEDSETLCRLRDVTISDCLVVGGVSGMRLGTTGLTGTTKFVERLQVSNVNFLNIATDANMSLNRALAAGIWCRAISNATFSNCSFYNCGVPAIMTDIVEEVTFDNCNAFEGTVDNANYAVSNEWERAHYIIRGTQNASDSVHLRDVRSVGADGAGIAVVHTGGSGKEVTNLRITDSIVDNPNQHGGSNAAHSAVYLLNIDAGEITEYDVDVINFTPSGSVIELKRATSEVTVEEIGVLEVHDWEMAMDYSSTQTTGSITAFADAGGGQVTVTTSAAHGLAENSPVTISGTTNYNGSFDITNRTSTTFEITDTWVSDDATGTWTHNTGIFTRAQPNTPTFRQPDHFEGIDKPMHVIGDAAGTGDGVRCRARTDALDLKQITVEGWIFILSGTVDLIEDSTAVSNHEFTTTGRWIKFKHHMAADQTNLRMGFLTATNGTEFYLGPLKMYGS